MYKIYDAVEKIILNMKDFDIEYDFEVIQFTCLACKTKWEHNNLSGWTIKRR